jgi:hypothetical protein
LNAPRELCQQHVKIVGAPGVHDRCLVRFDQLAKQLYLFLYVSRFPGRQIVVDIL